MKELDEIGSVSGERFFQLKGGDMGHKPTDSMSAYEYGRNGEPLPDIHVYSALSRRDAVYTDELQRLRARQEVCEREIMGLAKRLSAPLDDGTDGRKPWYRNFGGSKSTRKA